MLKIKIIDKQFAHAPNSFGCGDLKNIFPKDFQWYRGMDNINDIVVITENSFTEVDSCREKIKVLLILEPPSINPEFYKFISLPQNYLKFNFILTYSDDLVNLNKDKFIPYYFGGCWIYPNNWKIYKKTKNISVIASQKRITEGHKLRHLAIEKFKNKIDGVFGRGYEILDYKLDGLKDYRYSIVIENEKEANMISEKVIDCFATGTIPIYCGTNKIFKHFNQKGILYFNNIEELESQINITTEEYYNSVIDAVYENLLSIEKLAVPENYLWDNFFKFFFTND